ncbi:hypothetical protein BKA56DRAFT_95923 [Ilyonectria sp. MPI-CAGE-AT-0026]|nr:hypothetical protein BKA56DRAFT_95923 [Ilyonectria sp. MPI-CAGE-AT-0026]
MKSIVCSCGKSNPEPYLHTAIFYIPMPFLTTRDRRHGPPYPFLPLLIVYVLQTSSFLVVIPIVSYMLSAAAYFTVLQLLAVNILSCFCRLPPVTRLVINAIGCVLWAAGFFTLAAYDVRQKLLDRCYTSCSIGILRVETRPVGI